MSNLFIAVHCCQCSTMQVKQRKKSSNKWSCVVCGQKQSLTKVFAQGPMAKDVRHFVQSFNMSRQFSDQNRGGETLEPVPDGSSADQSPINPRKRTDWTEYIDPDQICLSEEEKDNAFEPKIVTELPEAVFKKPKLSVSARRLNNKNDVKLLKPVFSRRTPSKSQAEQPRNCASASSNFNRGGFNSKGFAPTQKNEINERNTFIELWEQLLSEDNSDTCKFPESVKEIDLDGHSDESFLNGISSDQRVEDEVHPEFM